MCNRNSQWRFAGASAKHGRATRNSAFTLMELLVVIAIIGILAALLLPAMAQSKAEARRIQCLSNLHQMVIAAHVYVDDNTESYPIAC